MKTCSISVDITKLPEVIAALRVEMANLLRAEAESDPAPNVARRLYELAAMFEVGATSQDGL